jgi:hypothetical protein
MALAHDLPFTWNAPGTDARTLIRQSRSCLRGASQFYEGQVWSGSPG